MQVTLLQGILLALFALIAGLDSWLEVFDIFRPIVAATVAGLILGDLRLGLIAGGIAELTFAGLTPAGGTQPPNPAVCGIMTVVIAHTSGVSPHTSLGLSIPFAMLMQYILLAYYSAFSLFMSKLDKCAEKGDYKGFSRINLLTMGIVAATFAIVIFLSTYAAQDLMTALIKSMPKWLIHGFEVAGGILPAVGFAMLLKVLLKIEFVPYLLIGFLIATFLNFHNVLPVAIVGLIFAMLEFYNQQRERRILQKIDELSTLSNGGGESDGI